MSHPPVIAIVDDDEAIRDALSDLLQVEGFASAAFDRAESFLSAYTPGAFACLVTDIQMPGMSGVELQRRLLALGADLPVIVVSSTIDPIIRVRMTGGGARAFLAKPVGAEALVREVKAVLASRGDKPDGGQG